jgi:hypothetical protein
VEDCNCRWREPITGEGKNHRWRKAITGGGKLLHVEERDDRWWEAIAGGEGAIAHHHRWR